MNTVIDFFPDRIDIPPPPCEKHGKCKHYDLCSAEKLACEAFAYYVGGRDAMLSSKNRNKPKQKNPAKEWYDACFISTQPSPQVESKAPPVVKQIRKFKVVKGEPTELLYLLSTVGQAMYKRETVNGDTWVGWIIAGKRFPHSCMHKLKSRGLARIYRDSRGIPHTAQIPESLVGCLVWEMA